MSWCDAAFPFLLAQDKPGGAGGLFGGPFDPVVLMVLIGTMFYFLLIRPERQRKEADRMLDSLKKNDKVVTIGGIYGVVVNVAKGSEDVTIRVDDGNNTRLRILRNAISRVVGTEGGDEKKDAS